MNFRKIKENEYTTITNIHLLAFNNFFLSSLGKRFLNTYYKACIKSNETIAVCVINEQDKILGYCIGCLVSKGFHKRLILQNLNIFLPTALIIVFTKPKALFRLVKNLNKNTNIIDDGSNAELLSIAVSPDYKNSGIGKELIKDFEKEAINNNCIRITLTTDYSNNDQVLSFYKKVGYTIFYEFTTYPKRRMFKLIKELSK